MPLRFGLFVIGDEILSGKRADRHLHRVIELLSARGLSLHWAQYLPDERAPLIEAGVTKSACLVILERAGITLPRSYAMGFPNANCLQSGCVKATSAAYWALYRHHFPDQFEKTAVLARELNVRLCRIDGERRFIDEIPADHPMTGAIVPTCDFLCQAAEMGVLA